MVKHLEQTCPSTYIVAVGFSLGGNIVTKYMGEQEGKMPRNVIGGISICQGYNAVEYVYRNRTKKKIICVQFFMIQQREKETLAPTIM